MRFYFNNRRLLDFVIGLLVGSLVCFQPIAPIKLFRWPMGLSFESLMLAVSTSSATMAGFVLAASTFLITHTADERFSMLRSSAGYLQFFDIIRSSMWRLIVLTGFAGLAALTAVEYQREALAIVAFLLSLGFSAVATLVWCTLTTLAIQTK